VADGAPQTLCARYAPADLDIAVELAATGRRALRDLLRRIDAELPGPALWAPAAGRPDVLADVDTPSDLARFQAGAQ
jgi:molybdopterin-guanine dinucleotide biosynthesis protein A